MTAPYIYVANTPSCGCLIDCSLRPLAEIPENHCAVGHAFIFNSSRTRGWKGTPQSSHRSWRRYYRCTPHREERLMTTRPLVSVVDDDEAVRESLPDLLIEFGFSVQAFSSAEAFLTSDYIGQTRCLILDIAMPGMTGPDLQRELKLSGKKFRTFLSPLRETRPSVYKRSNRVPWRACSSRSATR